MLKLHLLHAKVQCSRDLVLDFPSVWQLAWSGARRMVALGKGFYPISAP